MEARDGMDRRAFLKGTAAALGLGAMGAPAPGGVLGAGERIHIGIIGCGGMGTHHTRHYVELSERPELAIRVIAVCDIYKPRLARARAICGGDAYHDYREMLHREDLDAVVIATPDHWHAKMAIDAMEAGKHVHVEKPMTLYWREARQVLGIQRKTKRVLQVGAEGCADDLFWQARRLIREGRIGKVVWTTGGVFRNDPRGDWNYPIDPGASPENLDWEAFLGPAPRRPFDPERFFRYRKYWDYSGGLAHDLQVHVLSALQIALGPEYPRRIVASGGIYVHHDRETPDTFHAMIEYPSDHVICLYTTQTTGEGIETRIRGDRGSIAFEGDEVIVTPEPPYARQMKTIRVGREPRPDHDTNWIQCMRTGGKPYCDVETGAKVMAALCAANRSWREKKAMRFDAEAMEIVPA